METNRTVEGLPEPTWIEKGTKRDDQRKTGKWENQMTGNEESYKLTFSQREGRALYQNRCA